MASSTSTSETTTTTTTTQAVGTTTLALSGSTKTTAATTTPSDCETVDDYEMSAACTKCLNYKRPDGQTCGDSSVCNDDGSCKYYISVHSWCGGTAGHASSGTDCTDCKFNGGNGGGNPGTFCINDSTHNDQVGDVCYNDGKSNEMKCFYDDQDRFICGTEACKKATTTKASSEHSTTLAPNDDGDDNGSGECSAKTTLGVAKSHMASALTKALDGDIRNINNLLVTALDEADVAISRVIKQKTIAEAWDAGCVRTSFMGCLCNPRGTVTAQITKIEGISSLRVTDFRNIRIDKQ